MEHEIHKTEVKQAIKTARTWSVLARGPARAATMAQGGGGPAPTHKELGLRATPDRPTRPEGGWAADASTCRPASSHNARPRRGVVARIFLTRTQAQNGQVTVWAAQRGCPHPEHGLPATKQLALSHPANDENEGQGLGPPWGVPEHQNKAYAPDQRGKPAVRDQPRDFRNQEILY